MKTLKEFKIKSYPAEILKLQTVEGFREWVIQTQSELNCRKMQAFDIVNDSFFDFFGYYKYADYQSFSVCLKRKITAV